ncbi:MAG: hypothetical protein HC893_02130 [Chloroflexaceae bacterium]|nr:hypothetical protein [Chloroflexaceae bacterium]NJL32859.1 hypothetical protein [Chloroflexaceae bacterium]NJO04511.1 hypothetical protein [Chloroflexaceae bacterium]
MKTYQLSATGRRMALVLLLAALAIWAFALWSFRSTLSLDYNPLNLWPSLQASIAAGLTVSQIVPALLMLVLIVATPLVIWNLLEEWAASYTPTEEGLRFSSLGVDLVYPWVGIQAIRRVDDDSNDPMDELILAEDYTGQITNPLLRFLHGQAYGRRTLPLYAGLADRDELLETIRQYTGLAAVPAAELAPADPVAPQHPTQDTQV